MNKAWDVIVAGAGTGGLVLATFAARRGARVLVADPAPRVGGTLHIATGQLSAAGTRLQAERGIEDSPEAHLADILRISKGTVDEGLVRLAVENAADTFEWLLGNGYEVLPDHPVQGQNHEPYSTPRYYWGPEAGRSILAALLPPFEAERAKGGITLLLETEVVALRQEDGAVTGVTVRRADGSTEEHTGRNVVLATGGYNSDPERFRKLNGVTAYAAASYPYARGRGLDLGVSAGGYVRGGEKYLCSFGSVLDHDDHPAPVLCRPVHWPEMRQPWEIYVNAHGERFVAEDDPSVDRREHALRAQPELRRWIVFDDRIAREAPRLVPDWPLETLLGHFGTHPMFHRADTLEELGRLAGVHPENLARTVAEYNAALGGEDPLGRTHRPLPVAEPPFYAIRVQGMSITSTAGLAVDTRLRVVDRAGDPVPNLYAIGEILGSGQLMGDSFCGGMLATPAMTFGRLLGDRMLTWT
ncbi:FAD-dependent oxidoreductase [Microbispora amethystogenes]|uniref:FAD-dependent oxidoreductase n=1 Tax=Microbispora amethystogenes TaxID=1427754 RepID=UPI0033ED3429